MNLDNFEKVKESEYSVVYLTRNRKNLNQIEMMVQYKKYNMFMRCLLSEAMFKCFFESSEYGIVYMKEGSKIR